MTREYNDWSGERPQEVITMDTLLGHLEILICMVDEMDENPDVGLSNTMRAALEGARTYLAKTNRLLER